MKRVLLTLCMVLPTIFIMASEKFTIGKYTFKIFPPTKVELYEADKSILSANISPTITYQGVTYRVMGIGDRAFYYCSKLTSATIPNSVKNIGWGAFEYCSSLISIAIPNSVKSIGNSAFEGCTSLTSITIPNSVTSIGWGIFWGCKSLTSIKYAGTKEQWKKIELNGGWAEKSSIEVVHCTDGEIRF